MKVQCSILESACKNLVESPLHALNGNEDKPVIYQVQISAQTPTPPWNLGMITEANQPPPGPLQAYINANTWFRDHLWGFDNRPDAPSGYIQNDVADISTFVVNSEVQLNVFGDEMLIVNAPVSFLFPGSGFPNGPIWEDGGGITEESIASEVYSFGQDVQEMISMIYGVDFTPIWNGTGLPISAAHGFPVAGNGQYWGDNIIGSFNRGYVANATGGLVQAIDPTKNADGVLYALSTNNPLVPILAEGNGASGYNGLGVAVTRVQYQIRNYPGTPVEYNFLEVLAGTSNNGPQTILIPRGGGQFTFDRQIVEVPFASNGLLSTANGVTTAFPFVIMLVGGSDLLHRV